MEKDYYKVLIPGLLETSLNLGVEEKWPLKYQTYFFFLFKHIFNKNLDYTELFSNIFNPNIEKGRYVNKNRNFVNNYLQKNNSNNFSIFTYNWLCGIEELSEEFIKFIEKIETDKEIQIIGYSYGGLIAYYSLSKKNDYKNLKKVKSFISVGTPFKGSIKATSLIFGTKGHDNSYELIKNFIHNPKFQSIYDLIVSYPTMVFLNDNNEQLNIETIENLFFNHPEINKEKLIKSIELRKKLNNISLIDIDFKCFIGNDPYSYIPQFLKVDKDNNIIVKYSKGSGDGVVSFYEAIPDYDEKETSSNYSIHYIVSSHSSILDSDEFLNELDILNTNGKSGILFIDVEKVKNTLKLIFKLDIENNIYNVRKFVPKNIFLTHNSNKLNLLDKIVSKNNETYIIINDEYYFGIISISKAKISYVNELNEKKEYFVKRLQIKYD